MRMNVILVTSRSQLLYVDFQPLDVVMRMMVMGLGVKRRHYLRRKNAKPFSGGKMENNFAHSILCPTMVHELPLKVMVPEAGAFVLIHKNHFHYDYKSCQ